MKTYASYSLVTLTRLTEDVAPPCEDVLFFWSTSLVESKTEGVVFFGYVIRLLEGSHAKAKPEPPYYLFWLTRLAEGVGRGVVFIVYVKKANGGRSPFHCIIRFG